MGLASCKQGVLGACVDAELRGLAWCGPGTSPFPFCPSTALSSLLLLPLLSSPVVTGCSPAQATFPVTLLGIPDVAIVYICSASLLPLLLVTEPLSFVETPTYSLRLAVGSSSSLDPFLLTQMVMRSRLSQSEFPSGILHPLFPLKSLVEMMQAGASCRLILPAMCRECERPKRLKDISPCIQLCLTGLYSYWSC